MTGSDQLAPADALPTSLPQATPARKRGTPRHHVQVRAAMRALDAHESREVESDVRDISLGGCRVQTQAALRVGSMWEIRVPRGLAGVGGSAIGGAPAGDSGGERTMLALVRWSSPIDEHMHAAGLQFLADPGLLGAVGLSTSDLTANRSELVGAGPAPWDVTFNLTAPKSLAVKALEGSTLRVGQHLEVSGSVKNCVLDIAGKLIASDATLAGGRTHVMGGAEVGELGSASGTPTQITLGRSLTASLLLSSAGPTLAQIDAEIDQDSLRLTELQARPSEQLSAGEREAVTVALYELQAKRQRRARIAANIAKLRSWDGKRERQRLHVARWVHAGVTIRIGDSTLALEKPVEGPCAFKLDRDGHITIESEAAEPPAAPESPVTPDTPARAAA